MHDPTYWQRRGSNHTLDVLSFEVYPEPSAGEAVFLKAGQEPIRQVLHAVKSTPCVFEYIYFARPDSVMDGKSVYERRLGYGRALVERIRRKGVTGDVVVPVSDTLRPAAA